MRIALLLFFALVTPILIKAQSAKPGAVFGTVKSGGSTVPFVNVVVKSTALGTLTGEDGSFFLEPLDPGNYTLSIEGLGYRAFDLDFKIEPGELLELAPAIQQSGINLDQVVVSASLKETFVSKSPVKVEVLTFKFLEKNKTTNLLDAVFSVNGIQKQVNCGVCYTSDIRINGLEGPYTLVMIDGSPVFGNLASVYGLSGIPTASIQRIEIIKGPSSTLYGSEAVAGVINVITKSPKDLPAIHLDLMGSSHGEYNLDFSVKPSSKEFNTNISGNLFRMASFLDENEDGFSDIVNTDRISLLNKWSFNRKEGKTFDISARLYWEDRRNGVKAYLENGAYKQLRGDSLIYGESILTKRGELFGTYDLPSKESIRLNFAASHHDQDSYYGNKKYAAKQQMLYSNLFWNKSIGTKPKNDLILGSTLRYQFYDDNTVATSDSLNGNLVNKGEKQFIPGIFVQNEMEFSDRLTILAGLRVDHYNKHSLIPAPRLSIKWKPAEYTTLRMNSGTGFRIVHLFAEDHAFVSGNRTVEIQEKLKPERSWNVSLNLNQILNIGNSSATLDIDGFYTYFSNSILPDYSVPGKIIYSNSPGHVVSKGMAISISQEFLVPFSLTAGATLESVTRISPDAEGIMLTEPVEFAPDWSAVYTLSYNIKKWKLAISYSGNITGPMQLPEVFDVLSDGSLSPSPRPTRSPVFTIQNLQFDKEFSAGWKVYCGAKNIWNWNQSSPLAAYNDTSSPPGFSPYFDTSYAFAPIHGREIFFGFSWNWDPKKK